MIHRSRDASPSLIRRYNQTISCAGQARCEVRGVPAILSAPHKICMGVSGSESAGFRCRSPGLISEFHRQALHGVLRLLTIQYLGYLEAF